MVDELDAWGLSGFSLRPRKTPPPSVGEGLGAPRAPGGTDPTGATQDQLRTLRWDDLMGYLREECHGASVPAELERLRVA